MSVVKFPSDELPVIDADPVDARRAKPTSTWSRTFVTS